jgi:hypothetical protein
MNEGEDGRTIIKAFHQSEVTFGKLEDRFRRMMEKAPCAGTALRVLVLCLVAAVIFFREPYLLTTGRFYAEEGNPIFMTVWNEGFLHALTSSINGYYMLYAWLSAGLATLVPLEYAPLVTAYCALAAMILPSAIILFAPLKIELSFWRRAVLAFILAIPVPGLEVWVTITSSSFQTALATALLLIVDLRTRSTTTSVALIALLTGLSGPVAIFTTPLFVLRALFERKPATWLLAGILCACALLQSYLMLSTLFEGVLREANSLSGGLAAASFIRLFSYPFFLPDRNWLAQGFKTQDFIVLEPYLALSAFIFLFLLWRALHTERLVGLWVLAAALLVTALCTIGSFRADSEILHILFRAQTGERYFFVGNMLVVALLLMPMKKSSLPAAVVTSILLGAHGLETVIAYRSYDWTGPVWAEEVEKWRADSTYMPQVWAGGTWVLILKSREGR